jgi:type IV pilus assembly protein PilM
LAIKDIIARIRGENITTGIDIGHYGIKLATMEHIAGRSKLIAAGVHILKPGTIVDGDIRDPAGLTEALVSLINRTCPDGLKGDLIVSLNWTGGVIADRIRINPQAGAQDEEVILYEAGNRSPFDEPDITLDYKILSKDEKGHMEVLLVAAKNAILSNWAEFYVGAGLSPVAMDVDSIASANVFQLVADEKDFTRVVGILNLGDKRCHITFLKEGVFHSTREIQSASVEYFIQVVCRHLGISSEEAGKILRGEKVDGFDPDSLQSAIDYAAEELSIGIDLAIQYFQSSEGQEVISKLYLCGGGANIKGLIQYLGQKMEIEAEVLNPLRKIKYDPDTFGGEIPDAVSNILTIALGMAMRKM